MIHKAHIPLGVKGEISYIQEEVAELADAHEQNINRGWTIIEAADVMLAVGKFTWRKYRVPFIVMVPIAVIFSTYKIFRNPVLNMMGKKKIHGLAKIQA